MSIAVICSPSHQQTAKIFAHPFPDIANENIKSYVMSFNTGVSEMVESRQLSASISIVCHRLRWHLLFVLALYVVSFAVGYVAIAVSHPFAVNLRTSVLEMITREAPFTTVTDVLRARNLLMAIALAFLVNLIFGAFFSTTFLGVVPLLGGGGISLITIYRGLTLGVVYHAVLTQSPVAFALGAGTLILELGGYVFSGAVGIALSLATIFPKRYGNESRWGAFMRTLRDVATLYIIVVVLLLAGAIWEMTGLFLLAAQT